MERTFRCLAARGGHRRPVAQQPVGPVTAAAHGLEHAQSPLAGEANLNPECAEERLCPAQPTGELRGGSLANQTGSQPASLRWP
jgi:hypothetical protein